jgi:hypothetical protein
LPRINIRTNADGFCYCAGIRSGPMSAIPLALSDELDQILYEIGRLPKPSFENLSAWEVDGAFLAAAAHAMANRLSQFSRALSSEIQTLAGEVGRLARSISQDGDRPQEFIRHEIRTRRLSSVLGAVRRARYRLPTA